MATIEELMRDAFERDRLSRPSPQAQAWQASRGTTMGGSPAPGAVPPSPAAAPTAPGAAQPGAIARAGKRLLGGAAKTGAAIVGPAQIGMGANEIAKGNTLEGSARLGAGALATAQMLPQKMLSKIPLARGLPGPVGLAAAASLSATDAMGLPAYGLSPSYLGAKAREAALQNETTRGWINTARGWFGEAPLTAQDSKLDGDPVSDKSLSDLVAPATAAQPATAAKPEASAGDWFNTPAAAAMNTAQGPVSRGPVSRRAASQPAQQRVAQLQQMAGQELMRPQEIARPPVAQVATDQQAGSGGIQVLGPADGYQGMNQVAPGVYEAPVWNGPSPVQGVPEGQVMIDRGGGQNIIQSFANTQKGGTERAAFMPELAGLSPGQLAEFINNSAGSSDPRIMSANKQAIDMVKQSMAETGATERTGMNVEGGIEQAREHTRSAGNVASISAQAQMDVANRPKYFPGQRTTNTDGSTAYTEPAIFNPADGSVMAPQRKKEVRTQPQIDSLVTQYRAKYKVDEKTARQAVMSIFDLKK